MGTCFLYGNGGGGSSGSSGTLTVTAPAGCTVTVSKDGKSKTKTSGADGVAVFKGLSSGEWTVTIANDTQTAQKTITITADYAVSIAFFAATINVTYPAGSTCTATDGTTTLTAPDTTGSWACIVPNAGTWTVSCTDGTKTKSITVQISTDGEAKSVTLGYIEYLVKSGVIDMTAHPHTATENRPAYNSSDYGSKPSLALYGFNGGDATHTFSKVTIPGYATKMGVEIYKIPSFEGTSPSVRIGGVYKSINAGGGHFVTDITVTMDVSAIAGTTVNFSVTFRGLAYHDICYIGNAWFE